MNNVNLIGLYVGVFAGFCFFMYGMLFCKRIPKLNQVAIVILAWTGATAGFYLGYIALTADDNMLCILKDQRVAIVLGALAVVWVAGESFFGSLRELRLAGDAGESAATSAD